MPFGLTCFCCAIRFNIGSKKIQKKNDQKNYCRRAHLLLDIEMKSWNVTLMFINIKRMNSNEQRSQYNNIIPIRSIKSHCVYTRMCGVVSHTPTDYVPRCFSLLTSASNVLRFFGSFCLIFFFFRMFLHLFSVYICSDAIVMCLT